MKTTAALIFALSTALAAGTGVAADFYGGADPFNRSSRGGADLFSKLPTSTQSAQSSGFAVRDPYNRSSRGSVDWVAHLPAPQQFARPSVLPSTKQRFVSGNGGNRHLYKSVPDIGSSGRYVNR